MVEVEAMTFMRGRSLSNTLFIIDEAQNLTPHEAKTVVSRMAEGSKVVLLGDPGQVDSMFLDTHSNGLVHTAQRLNGDHGALGIGDGRAFGVSGFSGRSFVGSGAGSL